MRPVVWALVAVGCGQDYAIVVPVDLEPGAVTECAFEPLDGRPAVEVYTCNPVFEATREGWADTVTDTSFASVNVLGHPFYQLWYFGLSRGVTQVGTAISEDGTTWTANPSNPGFPEPEGRAWDGDDLQAPRVAWDAKEQAYWMLYGGFATDGFSGIGVAGSRDGVSWEKLPANPVLSLDGPYDGVDLAWPLAFEAGDDGYDAWFAGTRGGEALSIYRLHTDDVRLWGESAVRELAPGPAGAWDDQGFLDAAVVELDGVEYLFYVGFGSWTASGGSTFSSEQFLGLARRPEGGEWERVGNGRLPLNLTREGNVRGVAARVVGSRIHLWVTDHYPDLGEDAVGYYVYDPAMEDR